MLGLQLINVSKNGPLVMIESWEITYRSSRQGTYNSVINSQIHQEFSRAFFTNIVKLEYHNILSVYQFTQSATPFVCTLHSSSNAHISQHISSNSIDGIVFSFGMHFCSMHLIEFVLSLTRYKTQVHYSKPWPTIFACIALFWLIYTSAKSYCNVAS